MFKLALFFLLLTPTCFAQNQQELNQQAQADFVAADKELNSTYRALMPRLDPASKKKLVDAQLVWIRFATPTPLPAPRSTKAAPYSQ